MPTIGQFIHQRLLEAADKGIIIADLHKERKANWKELGLTYKTGTYSSFVRLFRWLIDLGYVEQTGETEVAFIKGTITELASPRTFYRLTNKGLAAPETDYYDLIATVHPEWSGSARSSKYRLPTGRPRGRPRVGAPKIKRLPKPPKVKKPRVRLAEVVLTTDEEEKLIEEFREIYRERYRKDPERYKRSEPTRTEIYELLLEETKLKRRRVKEEIGGELKEEEEE